MAHFAIVCPPISGHLDPLAALGRTLIRRGHRVSVCHVSELETRARAQGLEFIALEISGSEVGSLAASVTKLAELKGLASLKFAVECARAISAAMLENGPQLLRAAAVDAMLVDQNEPAGGTLAEYLGLPFVSACTSLPLNRESLIPPPFVDWAYGESIVAKVRNWTGYAIADRLIAPIENEINRYRSRWGLQSLHGPDSSFSKRAQIAQMSREFDFPRHKLPGTFHYLGPWFDDFSSTHVPFPYEKLDGRPLIYGSIGTLQQVRSPMFSVMAEACKDLDAQLVLSLGHPGQNAPVDLPGNPVVVNYAPQIELLRRASVTITHGGMNTTQQSLYFGVPIVAIPLAHDQPAIAARLVRTGAGIAIKPARLTAARLGQALNQLLPADSSFRREAQRMSKASRAAGCVDAAASIVERAIS